MKAVGLRVTASVWLVTATFSLGAPPASAGAPMGLGEAAQRLASGVPGPTELQPPPPPPAAATPVSPEMARLLDLQSQLSDANRTEAERAALAEQIKQGLQKLSAQETWRQWRSYIHDEEAKAQSPPPMTAAAELVTLRDALANDKDMTPEEKARIMRRVAQLMAQTADDEARRRRQQIISEDPVAETAAMVDSTLNYYAVLSCFHEYEQDLASAYRADPATVHWLALAGECRRVIGALKLDNVDYAAPILLRLRLLPTPASSSTDMPNTAAPPLPRSPSLQPHPPSSPLPPTPAPPTPGAPSRTVTTTESGVGSASPALSLTL